MKSISIFKELKKSIILNLTYAKTLSSFYTYIITQTNTRIKDYLMDKKYSTIQEHFYNLLQQFNKEFKIFTRVRIKKIFKEFHNFGHQDEDKDFKKKEQFIEIEKKLNLQSKKIEMSLLKKLDSFNYKTQLELDHEVKGYISEYFLNKKIFCFDNFKSGDESLIGEKQKVIEKVENVFEQFEKLEKDNLKYELNNPDDYKTLNKGCQVQPKVELEEIDFVKIHFFNRIETS